MAKNKTVLTFFFSNGQNSSNLSVTEVYPGAQTTIYTQIELSALDL